MKHFAFCDEATGEVISAGSCPDADFALQSPPAGQTLRERPAAVACGWAWNAATQSFDPPAEEET